MKRSGFFAVICMVLVICTASAYASGTDGIRVHYVEQALDLEPGAEVWDNAESFNIELLAIESLDQLGVTHTAGTLPEEFIRSIPVKTDFVINLAKETPDVSVQAVHNGTQVAIRFVWEDSTEDIENSLNSYRDGLAVLFPLDISDGYKPSPLMGARGEAVNIWQWKAEWQAAMDGRRKMDRQPLAAGFYISPTDRILKDRTPGKTSGLVNQRERIEYVAEGYGTLTKQVQQDVDAKGRYKGGKYRVVFLRDIKRTDLSDAEFAPAKKTYLNVAVWNGSEGNVDGMKSVTFSWTPITFDPAPVHAMR